jgi:sodium/hydrogen antiporter
VSAYLLLTGFIVLYALAAARLEYLWITGPIVFVVVGFVVGTGGAGLVELGPNTELVKVVTELTLALLLFADASSIDLRALRRDTSAIFLLLSVGLILAIAFGALAAWLLLPALSLGLCALVASILCPTDLSLGLAMFKNPLVPERVRRSLNVESGLNDGIATPFVTLFIGVAVAEAGHSGHPVVQAVTDILIGVGVGIAVGAGGAWLMRVSTRRGWSSAASRQFAALALALLAYGAAVALGGNGFIAAFVGGLAFGAMNVEVAAESVEYAEQTGTLMTLAVWFIFGAVIAPILVSDAFHWRPIVYALVSLTAVRMLAIAVALRSRKLHRSSVIFFGWFGPRGLASVVFLIMAIEALGEAGVVAPQFVAAAGWTIFLSVILHGLSAGPVAAWYARKAADFAPGSPELEVAEPLQTRRGLSSPSSRGGK